MSAPIRQALTDTEAHGRLLLTQDPTLRRLTHRQGTTLDTHAATAETLPVALVEPVYDRVMLLDDGSYPLTLAIAAKLGLSRFRPYVAPQTAANWTFRDGTHCELVDPTGTVLARFPHVPNLQWRSAAHTHQYVIVLYGGRLGVRRPGGELADKYDDHARDDELHTSLTTGAVVAGVATYVRQ